MRHESHTKEDNPLRGEYVVWDVEQWKNANHHLMKKYFSNSLALFLTSKVIPEILMLELVKVTELWEITKTDSDYMIFSSIKKTHILFITY
jgi:hypothetical protein